MIAVLVPALGRPERVEPLLASLEASSRVATRVLYLLSPGDSETLRRAQEAGVEAVVVPFELAGGDYARKINHGLALVEEPWVLQGSDDIRFTEGWDDEALSCAERKRARVVGTNDLGNPLVMRGGHATHSLIARSYVEECGTVDEEGKALHEGYWHCWVDNELVETARARGEFAAARRSVVEHLHHIWHKGDDDDTYRRGQEGYELDRRLFLARRPLWAARRRRR